MYKFVVLLVALAAVASAAPGGIIAAPAAVVAHTPVATSYANTYKVSVKSPIIAAAAPIDYVHTYAAAPAATYLKTAPIAYAAHPAPLAYAAAPAYVRAPVPFAYGYGAAAYIH